MNEYIFIRLLEDLPCTIEAVTVPDTDGNFNIYVNAKLSRAQQFKASEHEMNHILMNHFYNCDPVIINELEANRQ